MPYTLPYRQSYGDISSVAVPYFQMTQFYIKLKKKNQQQQNPNKPGLI